MAATIHEHALSGSETWGTKDGGDAKLRYIVLGTNSPLEVRALVNATIQEKYHELIRNTANLEPLGGGVWNVGVNYCSMQDKTTITYDTTCEKIKRMKSLETIANYNLVSLEYDGVTGPDFGGLIGVSKDKVEGVEVYAKGMAKLTIKWSSNWQTIPATYLATVKSMGATVNDRDMVLSYRGQQIPFPRGTLLFIGGPFTESDDSCEITLNFLEIENDDNITIGERGTFLTEFGPLFKEGHHYMWIRTNKVQDPRGAEIDAPTSAHVERVYEYADFGLLEVFDMIEEFQEDNAEILEAEQEEEETLHELEFQGFTSP